MFFFPPTFSRLVDWSQGAVQTRVALGERSSAKASRFCPTVHALCICTGTRERMDSWLARTALPWPEAGHGPVGSSSIQSTGSGYFRGKPVGSRMEITAWVLWLAWTTSLGAPPAPNPTRVLRVSQSGAWGHWEMGGQPVESPARPSSGEAVPPSCPSVQREQGRRGAGCLQWAGLGWRWCRGALSQLVNHCRGTAISWLPIPGVETQGHSCWEGWGGRGGPCLFSGATLW